MKATVRLTSAQLTQLYKGESLTIRVKPNTETLTLSAETNVDSKFAQVLDTLGKITGKK